ncbi:MAG: hypothetical protein ACLF0P_10175 [Thermoanaerobaculia bacterium]
MSPSDPMCHTLPTEGVVGTVYGVPLWGRLPAAFREYLLPPEGMPSSVAGRTVASASGGDGERSPAAEPRDGAIEPLEVRYRQVAGLPQVDEIWASEPAGPEDAGRFGLFRLPEPPDGFGLTVTFPGRGLFRCGPRAVEIDWTGSEAGAAHAFFAYALPLWLEAAGVPVLHGCGVVLGGRAVGFLGRSGVGKSTLCAELVRRGCPFLSDDGLALRRDGDRGWRCAAGPPFLRLWPSALEGRLGTSGEGLPRVHDGVEKRRLSVEKVVEEAVDEAVKGAGREGALPGGEAASGAPLGGLYLLDRRPGSGGPVEVLPCRGPDALAALIEHSVCAAPAAALGLSARRLHLLADLAEGTRVRRLRYPSGSGAAGPVRDAILRDLDGEGSCTRA